MYKVATFLLEHFWGNVPEMTNASGVLLLTWNQAFYRYGSFDFDKLEKCIKRNIPIISGFRQRNISSLSSSDEDDIKRLFREFLDALQIDSGKKRGTKKSPVSAAKALHLLAPMFFPLWDNKIAKGYECDYSKNPDGAYIEFCKITKRIASKVETCSGDHNKTTVKLIDEYNYSKYTKNWI